MAVLSPAIVALLTRLNDAVAADWRVVTATVLLPAAICGAVAGRSPVEVLAIITLLGIFGDAIAATALNPSAIRRTGAPGLAIVRTIVALFTVGIVHGIVTATGNDLAVDRTSTVRVAIQRP